MDDVFDIEKVVADGVGSDGEILYQVRWKGFGATSDTWEPEENFLNKAVLNKYKKAKAKKMSALGQKLVTPAKPSKLKSKKFSGVRDEPMRVYLPASDSEDETGDPNAMPVDSVSVSDASQAVNLVFPETDSNGEVVSVVSSGAESDGGSANKGDIESKPYKYDIRWKAMPSEGLQKGWTLRRILSVFKTDDDTLFCLVAWEESIVVDLIPHQFVVQYYPALLNDYVIKD